MSFTKVLTAMGFDADGVTADGHPASLGKLTRLELALRRGTSA
ncbi:MAG TPA: hypothetical protein VK053_15765 [Jiangellaceae bacterium]|nr:hypothetical protein [Jiangellaceae bacterium]